VSLLASGEQPIFSIGDWSGEETFGLRGIASTDTAETSMSAAVPARENMVLCIS